MNFTLIKYTRFFIICLIFLALLLLASCGSDKDAADAQFYHEMGLRLYKEGYYDLLPKGNVDEANQKLEQAEKAFREAIALDDGLVESHRYLARVCTVEKKYSEAANAYLKTIELDPDNMDNYLFLASVYVRMKRYNDAEKVLAHAKTFSKEPAVIDQIHDLIGKIRERALE